MTSKYIPVTSVIYDLSLTIDDRYWNEAKMIEWVNKGAQLLATSQMLEGKLAIMSLVNHKAELPEDFKYLTQIAYNTTNVCSSTSTDCFPELNLPDNSDLGSKLDDLTLTLNWKPMRLTTNPFHTSICLDSSITSCPNCDHEFSISTSLVLTSTLKEGTILVAYLGLPKDSDNNLLIPDSEEVKEALLHYALYRHWMSRYSMKEDGAEQRMKHHLTMWNTLGKKAAGNLNLPDVNELENIKNMFNRLVPRDNMFAKFFIPLNGRENINF